MSKPHTQPPARPAATHAPRPRASRQRRPAWPASDLQWLRQRLQSPDFSVFDAAVHLSRSVHAVQLQAAQLRLQAGGLHAVAATTPPARTPYLPATAHVAAAAVQGVAYEPIDRGLYTGLPAGSARPGALDAAHLPSRVGRRLHWPDRRVTALDGGALT